MQKTRLGISVGLLAAAIYFTSFFGGYLVAILLAGYVLTFEADSWLKKSAVKAVGLLILFSFLSAVINLVPNLLGFVNDVLGIFGVGFGYGVISHLISAVLGILDILEKVLFLALGVSAFKQKDVDVPVVDSLIGKYM